jgi:aconitate hydratase
MHKEHFDPFGARSRMRLEGQQAIIYRLEALETAGITQVARLPYAIRVLLESMLRHCDGHLVTEEDVRAVAGWRPNAPEPREVPFMPARVLLQDFTGVPAVADLAAMRSALLALGSNEAERINPLIPVDLVIDHSLQVDHHGAPRCAEANVDVEFKRNRERYTFLKWAQGAFRHLRVVPPGIGIIHQVNLEHLADVVQLREQGGVLTAYPDSLVGTDSHTTMINGLGVLGWGVGGIEAEAVMLGQPYYMLLPEVVGFRLTGELPAAATATDLVLTITQMLRQKGVVEKFVEFHGPGLASLGLADRATIANMAPEYGATMGFFAVDEEVLAYLRATGKPEQAIQRVEAYCKEQGLFRQRDTADPEYSDLLTLDMSTVEPSVAGPRRPQDRLRLSQVKSDFAKQFASSLPQGERRAEEPIDHGAVVIAAITSCTNTSNPSVMIGAGLVAKKAVGRGLQVPSHVKTSLAPGSRVVRDYLAAAGLLPYLEKLGFHVVGYGCTTCIGNSGPLPQNVAAAVDEGDLVVAAVLSGNRNFEGRVHPQVKANYLASPMLVVAYALAGRVDVDLTVDPVGLDAQGQPVFLHELWPSRSEIAEAAQALQPEMYQRSYGQALHGDENWQDLVAPSGVVYQWDTDSSYLQEPPFFAGMSVEVPGTQDIHGARALVVVGDSVTTDHISPAGAITPDSPAANYLRNKGVKQSDFNSYGSRRGNHEVMMRGTFANIRLRNILSDREGGWTTHLPSGEQLSIYDAAMRYKQESTPLLVLAGKEYGTGSSRDWAAKGPYLLGVKAVIAQSYERIHRSNLVGMGVLPLQFLPGESIGSLGLTGREVFDIQGLEGSLQPRQRVQVRAQAHNGTSIAFEAVLRLDSTVEVEYYLNGGILQTVLRHMAADA